MGKRGCLPSDLFRLIGVVVMMRTVAPVLVVFGLCLAVGAVMYAVLVVLPSYVPPVRSVPSSTVAVPGPEIHGTDADGVRWVCVPGPDAREISRCGA